MQRRHDDGVALSAFDQLTATAVVTVLRRAGVSAWLASDGGEDVEVRVPDGQREVALRELGARMEEVQAAVSSAQPAQPPAVRPAPPPDPDDVHAGPPLVMERLRSMRILAAVIMAPLLVVTLAPTLRGSAARVIVLTLAIAAAVAIVVLRRRR